jgi:hypothetical protein
MELKFLHGIVSCTGERICLEHTCGCVPGAYPDPRVLIEEFVDFQPRSSCETGLQQHDCRDLERSIFVEYEIDRCSCSVTSFYSILIALQP